MSDTEHSLPSCTCRVPVPGPLYWDWRCRKCSGSIDKTTMWEYVWVLAGITFVALLMLAIVVASEVGK